MVTIVLRSIKGLIDFHSPPKSSSQENHISVYLFLVQSLNSDSTGCRNKMCPNTIMIESFLSDSIDPFLLLLHDDKAASE